jgi:hypothetical protein
LAPSHSPLAEYAWFVATASAVWFMYGIALQALIRVVRRLSRCHRATKSSSGSSPNQADSA